MTEPIETSSPERLGCERFPDRRGTDCTETHRKAMTRPHGRITGLFGKRRDPVEFVQPGAVYRRVRADRVVERAEVIDSYADAAGIPHVRYDVTLESPSGLCMHEGTRVLSLRAFSERFAAHLGEVAAQG